MTLKDELPRSVGDQYATGEVGRNNSRKKEETEPKWKQCPVVDVSGDGNSLKYSTRGNLKNDKMISVHFQGKPFNITLTQVYAPTSNAQVEVERF